MYVRCLRQDGGHLPEIDAAAIVRGRVAAVAVVFAYCEEGTELSRHYPDADLPRHSLLSAPMRSKLLASNAGRQSDRSPQCAVAPLPAPVDRVDDAHVKALLLAQRVLPPRKLPPPQQTAVTRRRVADPEPEIDERVARGARRYVHRQPEVNNGVGDDVIGGEPRQPKVVCVSP